jgi:hypothetical protein
MTAVVSSIVVDFWQQLVAHDRQAVFLVLVGFVGSFAFIRMSTRIARSPRAPWWPGSIVSDSGVHVHHLVPGIFSMLAAGTMGFAVLDQTPWVEIAAVLFGIGAGLTIDEFALWLYLDDVYWLQEGRRSVDATVIAGAAIGLVVLGVRPIDIVTGTAPELIASVVIAVIVFAAVAVCFAKQRLLHGSVGLFVLPIAIYGAARIGKPRSPWARRFYGGPGDPKRVKAEDRFRPDRRTERFKERFRDIVGGKENVGANPPPPGSDVR